MDTRKASELASMMALAFPSMPERVYEARILDGRFGKDSTNRKADPGKKKRRKLAAKSKRKNRKK